MTRHSTTPHPCACGCGELTHTKWFGSHRHNARNQDAKQTRQQDKRGKRNAPYISKNKNLPAPPAKPKRPPQDPVEVRYERIKRKYGTGTTRAERMKNATTRLPEPD